MEIGLIGLGKMGHQLALNLLDNGHSVTGYDVMEYSRKQAEDAGIKTVASLEELAARPAERKVMWMMVPAGEPLETVLNEMMGLLDEGDILIDGGNSNYKDSIRHAEIAAEKELYFMDLGTSGGTSGAREGACMMIGGNEEAFRYIEPVIQEICVEDGYLYTGKSGSGHFLKMVHNGVEYGMMQAMGEGFELVEKSGFDYDSAAVAKVWNNGSVIRSWLMELAEQAFQKDGHLDEMTGIMQSSGEGQWTVETGLELKVPTPVISMSLMMRYRSLQEDTYAGKVVSALRNEFGGHGVIKK
ncbi:decarboxylating 6-phosphogluconate dehydrogenase [Desemzia sp. RIT804]|uniref:phosphogluconate dehydrogenase (NAD(+)-dependent, decarboxylating) n=1 Tax=Desemzia sp. RIT 804 TaxID=2810209 RepID=UPI001951C40D|nr:decarboxylating 6-phosphogluconate dehydrogenase [Desemzia sp. RIT 804]MBM6614764.1 decarboxylating 6-phosphogluconate dehydrogenase [Desemzia sp. RIT 804]